MTDCSFANSDEPVLVYYDKHAQPIFKKAHIDINYMIWDELHNLVDLKREMHIIKEESPSDVDAFLKSEKFMIAIVPDAHYVDGVLKFFEWSKTYPLKEYHFGFIREVLNDKFEGNLLRIFGHFRHLPNDSSVRVIKVVKTPTLQFETIIL